MSTYAEAMQHGRAMRALREPCAIHHAQHKAREHAERIGGEWSLDPMGFAVYPPAAPTPEPRHESVRLFEPAPAVMPGQGGLFA